MDRGVLEVKIKTKVIEGLLCNACIEYLCRSMGSVQGRK